MHSPRTNVYIYKNRYGRKILTSNPLSNHEGIVDAVDFDHMYMYVCSTSTLDPHHALHYAPSVELYVGRAEAGGLVVSAAALLRHQMMLGLVALLMLIVVGAPGGLAPAHLPPRLDGEDTSKSRRRRQYVHVRVPLLQSISQAAPLGRTHVPVPQVSQPTQPRAAGHQQLGRRRGQVILTAQDEELLE